MGLLIAFIAGFITAIVVLIAAAYMDYLWKDHNRHLNEGADV